MTRPASWLSSTSHLLPQKSTAPEPAGPTRRAAVRADLRAARRHRPDADALGLALGADRSGQRRGSCHRSDARHRRCHHATAFLRCDLGGGHPPPSTPLYAGGAICQRRAVPIAPCCKGPSVWCPVPPMRLPSLLLASRAPRRAYSASMPTLKASPSGLCSR